MTAWSGGRRWLLPLVPVYRVALAARGVGLRRGWEPVRRLRFPVISVGNPSTGGAGKTPFAIALARALGERGFAVDVLSRGYGRRSGTAAEVDPAGSAEDFGDEPLLIAREGGVPVYVARQRYEAGLMAEAVGGDRTMPVADSLEDSHPSRKNKSAARVGHPVSSAGCEERGRVHVLDDGFQHRQLGRDVDVLLLNGEDWRDRLLPAGNLREPLAAAKRADAIVISEGDAGLESELRAWGWTGPVWWVRRRMEVPEVAGPVVAFCGIARPRQFFAGLEAAGVRVADAIVFRDHHRYTASDLDRLRRAARARGAAALITTAKDRVRMERMLMPDGGDPPVLTAGLRIEIEDEAAVLDWLEERLRRAARAENSL